MHLMRGELVSSNRIAEQLLRLAESPVNPALLLYAEFAFGISSFWLGESRTARDHIERALVLYKPELHGPLTSRYQNADAGVTCTAYLAWILWHLGYPDQARKRAEETINLARELCHPSSLTLAEIIAGFVYLYRGELVEARNAADAVNAVSTEYGFSYWLNQATVLRGAAIAERGDRQAATELMRHGLMALEGQIGHLQRLCLLAEWSPRCGPLRRRAGHPSRGPGACE
jgi:hypothetical protein